jgi:hypothetical protein
MEAWALDMFSLAAASVACRGHIWLATGVFRSSCLAVERQLAAAHTPYLPLFLWPSISISVVPRPEGERGTRERNQSLPSTVYQPRLKPTKKKTILPSKFLESIFQSMKLKIKAFEKTNRPAF